MHNPRLRLRRAVLAMTMGVLGSLLWSAAATASTADAAILHAAAVHTLHADTHPAKGGRVRGHKQGTVAVVVSVIGIIAVVVGIVFLGSTSARRRMGGRPITKGQRGPPGGRRGLFG
jgi:hypothetical protein